MFTYSLARQDSVILRSEKTLTAIVSGLKLGTLKSGPFPVLAQLFGSLHTKAGRALEASSNIRIFVAIRYDRGFSCGSSGSYVNFCQICLQRICSSFIDETVYSLITKCCYSIRNV
ncbi:hypothetical protein CRM22_002519 [Opisthorchis felineus]|uniref:Uncharacterized protein n=1 Tax=Opisthorchis felineus TaxID=147828 RepID=A0A4S2MA37_OPIFE|nr:hypothetical protein CRM22_002519 [Opisthorchis felineus]